MLYNHTQMRGLHLEVFSRTTLKKVFSQTYDLQMKQAPFTVNSAANIAFTGHIVDPVTLVDTET